MIFRKSLALAALAATAVIIGVVFAGVASAALSVLVKGASEVSKTAVEISFNTAVDSTATNPADYVITSSAGSLAVSAATLTAGSHAVILTTDRQTNAVVYTVSVSGITNLAGTQTAEFIGTSLGANSATSFQDDFNRPSGLATTDTPISGHGPAPSSRPAGGAR